MRQECAPSRNESDTRCCDERPGSRNIHRRTTSAAAPASTSTPRQRWNPTPAKTARRRPSRARRPALPWTAPDRRTRAPTSPGVKPLPATTRGDACASQTTGPGSTQKLQPHGRKTRAAATAYARIDVRISAGADRKHRGPPEGGPRALILGCGSGSAVPGLCDRGDDHGRIGEPQPVASSKPGVAVNAPLFEPSATSWKYVPWLFLPSL